MDTAVPTGIRRRLCHRLVRKIETIVVCGPARLGIESLGSVAVTGSSRCDVQRYGIHARWTAVMDPGVACEKTCLATYFDRPDLALDVELGMAIGSLVRAS